MNLRNSALKTNFEIIIPHKCSKYKNNLTSILKFEFTENYDLKTNFMLYHC